MLARLVRLRLSHGTIGVGTLVVECGLEDYAYASERRSHL
jgi:hypothetical protein